MSPQECPSLSHTSSLHCYWAQHAEGLWRHVHYATATTATSSCCCSLHSTVVCPSSASNCFPISSSQSKPPSTLHLQSCPPSLLPSQRLFNLYWCTCSREQSSTPSGHPWTRRGEPRTRDQATTSLGRLHWGRGRGQTSHSCPESTHAVTPRCNAMLCATPNQVPIHGATCAHPGSCANGSWPSFPTTTSPAPGGEISRGVCTRRQWWWQRTGTLRTSSHWWGADI